MFFYKRLKKLFGYTDGSLLQGKTWAYYALVSYFHRFLRKFFSWRIRKPEKGPPKKILLANWGSLGDVVLSTGVIAQLKSFFPECQIGLITSEESKEVCQTSPPVDWIHTARFWLHPRLKKWEKMRRFLWFLFFEQSRITKEITKIDYDCAIELRPFFPNLIPVFWKAKIPIRIGFMTSGNGHLLSASANWESDRYLPYCYAPLLNLIGIGEIPPEYLMPQIIVKKRTSLLSQKPYFLFHLCASDPIKELPIKFWQELYAKCKEKGCSIYFTGKGRREFQIIEQVAETPDKNLCDRLSWNQFVQRIQECKGLVSVDSVSIHIAAAFQIPTLALFVSTPSPALWRPPLATTIALGINQPFDAEDAFQSIEFFQVSKEVGPANRQLI